MLIRISRWTPWLLMLLAAAPGETAGTPRAGLEFGPQIQEPYPQLTGGGFNGPAVTESPDPLVAYRWRTARADDGLQVYTLRPQRASADKPDAFRNLHSAVSGKTGIIVRGTGSIMFDFGVESAAWLEFDSPDLAGEVEMSVSEYNQPAIVNRGPKHPSKTAAPVRYGNTYRLELNRELYEGVRFGWIHVKQAAKPWHITAVRLVCQTKPANYAGSFRASDPLLTRIWYSGAYAVKMNLLKDYFGAILMDRGDRISWTGDAHPAQAAALVAFGNWDFIKANLERTARVDNQIASYSLYWVLSLVDYYRYTGDTAAFYQLAPLALEKIARAQTVWDNPQIHFYGWDERLGAGFEDPNYRESQAAYRFLAIRACRELAWAFTQAGRPTEAGNMENVATRFRERLQNRAGWQEHAGLHVAAEAVTAGLAETTQALWSREFTDPVNRLSYSPFNQYFVLQAMARVGMYEEALAVVRELWGGQLQYGGTCFFEVFRPSWNLILKPNDPVPNCQAGYTSLCHPWSSGVTKWLSEEVLGIRPITPGFATYAVLPHPGRALQRVAGATPTPHGDISAELDARSGRMAVTAPAGTRGTIGIPKLARNIAGISTRGRLVWDGAFHPTVGIGGAHEDALFVYLTDVAPGSHEFQIRYRDTAKSSTVQQAAAKWPARLIKVEPARPGVYGTDGSVRFSIGDSRLPEYVAEVTHRNSRAGQWRTTGYLMTGNPNATKQTMTVDVRLKADHTYRMALYLVDGDNQQRRMAVELFDLETRNLIAPVALVDDFAKGKYLVYEYNRSCRVRLNHVTGGDAVISGILFDSPTRSDGGK